MRYPVVIHKDPDSDYGVTVPDLPGCFSAGSTMDEALDQAVAAIELHLEGMLLDNESIPLPKPVEEHQQNLDFAGGVWAFATVDLSRISGKSKKGNCGSNTAMLGYYVEWISMLPCALPTLRVRFVTTNYSRSCASGHVLVRRSPIFTT
jgi:predicted RNase H-like HicB family nuclease